MIRWLRERVLRDARAIHVRYQGELITQPVRNIEAQERPLAELVEDFGCWFDHPDCPDGVTLTIPTGYRSDWSSTPRIIWWLYPPHYGPARWGCWFHDRIYTHEHNRIPKHVADDLLAACMLRDGAGAFAAAVWRLAVGAFGRGRWLTQRGRNVE